MATFYVELFDSPRRLRGTRLFDADTVEDAIAIAEGNLTRTGADYADVCASNGGTSSHVTRVRSR